MLAQRPLGRDVSPHLRQIERLGCNADPGPSSIPQSSEPFRFGIPPKGNQRPRFSSDHGRGFLAHFICSPRTVSESEGPERPARGANVVWTTDWPREPLGPTLASRQVHPSQIPPRWMAHCRIGHSSAEPGLSCWRAIPPFSARPGPSHDRATRRSSEIPFARILARTYALPWKDFTLVSAWACRR